MSIASQANPKRVLRRLASPFRRFFNQHFAMVKQEIQVSRTEQSTTSRDLVASATRLTDESLKINDAATFLGMRLARLMERQEDVAAAVSDVERKLVAAVSDVERKLDAAVGGPGHSIAHRLDSVSAFLVASHWHAVDLVDGPALAMRVIRCPLCGHSSERDGYTLLAEAECQFGGGRLERYQCPTCDFGFGPLKMLDLTEPMLMADYRLLYDTYQEANSTESEMRAFHALEPARDGVFLNWGCGWWSETIDELRADGWDVWGYEPSAPTGSPYVVGALGQISANFDGIFSNNVIEHFRDPVAEFREMASHLRPGGQMTHASACHEFRHTDTRFHTAFYLGRSIEVLADRAGLQVAARVADGPFMSTTFEVP